MWPMYITKKIILICDRNLKTLKETENLCKKKYCLHILYHKINCLTLPIFTESFRFSKLRWRKVFNFSWLCQFQPRVVGVGGQRQVVRPTGTTATGKGPTAAFIHCNLWHLSPYYTFLPLLLWRSVCWNNCSYREGPNCCTWWSGPVCTL